MEWDGLGWRWMGSEERGRGEKGKKDSLMSSTDDSGDMSHAYIKRVRVVK
jgi:hypothetical protein